MIRIVKPVSFFLAFSAAGFLIMLFSGQGSYVTCAPVPGPSDCYLKKRNFWRGREEKFSRSAVKDVERNVIVSYGTQGRKSSEEFWVIRFKDNTALPVADEKFIWPQGNMSFSSLRQLLMERLPANANSGLRLIAFAAMPWFFGLFAAVIGWLALVYGLALAGGARTVAANALRILLVTAAVAGFWWGAFRTLQKIFTS